MKSAAPRIDPEWLTTFLAVSEQGGVLAASRMLHVSQPALSTRLRRLEAAVGKPLFDRSPRGMGLTEAGRRLLPVARKLAGVVAEALEAVEPEAVRPAGPLRLAASTTLANHVLPPLLAEMARRHALPGMDLRVGNTDEVLAAVRHGRVALGAVEGLARAAGLRLEPLAQDELLPVCAPDRMAPEIRARVDGATTLKAFLKLPILWREPGSGTRRVIEEALRALGAKEKDMRADYVLGGTLALKGAVLAGMGVAFLPRSAITQELALKRLEIVPKPAPRVRRTFSWVLSPGTLPRELEVFMRLARERLAAREEE